MALIRSKNGQDRSEAMDDQQQRSLENVAVQEGWRNEDGMSEEVLRFLAQTDLPPASKQKFEELMSRDFVFANLNSPEVEEQKWLLRVLRELFVISHPSPECYVRGEWAKAINDDPRAGELGPLDEQDMLEVDALFKTVWLRLTRSRGMEQQRVIQTSISQSEINRPGQGSSDSLLGRLSR